MIIPYGYTARAYREYEDGTTRIDLTNKSVDEDHMVNDGFTLDTEPLYTSITSKELNNCPSDMRVSATFFAENTTQNYRIVVESEKRTVDPIFDAHYWFATDNANGRGATGKEDENSKGDLSNRGDGNLNPENSNYTWGVLAKDPTTLSSDEQKIYNTYWARQNDGTYSLQWIFQTNGGDSFLFSSFEMNGETISLPYVPEELRGSSDGAGKGGVGLCDHHYGCAHQRGHHWRQSFYARWRFS